MASKAVESGLGAKHLTCRLNLSLKHGSRPTLHLGDAPDQIAPSLLRRPHIHQAAWRVELDFGAGLRLGRTPAVSR